MPDEILLRPWAASDAEALRAVFLTTPDLDTQFGGADLSTVAGAGAFIDAQLISGDTRRNWAIVDGRDDRPVGNVGLSAIERRHDTAWAFYWLASAARGRGIATRALVSAAEWAFDEGLFRIELGHRVNNPASCRVAARAGFLAEGVERQKLRYGSDRFDVELHSRLATDPVPAVVGIPR